MGVLFDKRVEDLEKSAEPKKAFVIVLEKYKMPVIVTEMSVNEDDEALLNIDFDHEIDAPENEVADELGKVIMERIEKGLDIMSDTMSIEKE